MFSLQVCATGQSPWWINMMPVALDYRELAFLHTKLKNGEYDGEDIMHAWLAVDELRELRVWRDKAFQAHPNLVLDIEALEHGA